MKMGLDLSRFKKMKEDEHSATLRHPAGHSITISKRILSPQLRNQVEKLPMHLAEGGSTGDSDPSASTTTTTSSNDSQTPGHTTNVIVNQAPQTPQQTMPQEAPPPQAAPKPNYISDDKSSPNYGTFDWNKWTLEQPDAPIVSKIGVLKNRQEEADRQAQANAQKQKYDYQNASEYNRLASQQGLPPMPIPNQPSPSSSSFQTTPGSAFGVNNATSTSPALGAPQGDPSNNIYKSFGANSMEDMYGKGIHNQISGEQGYANAMNAQGQAQVKDYQDQQTQVKSLMNNYETNMTGLTGEMQKAMDDHKMGYINPNHFIQNMGTRQKLSVGIGLILGGMGAGLTHSNNDVLDSLNKQIENDIQAQKSNSDSLFNFYKMKFGSQQDATHMMLALNQNMLANKIGEAAAQNMGPEAKARAQVAIGQLQSNSAQNLQSIAYRQATMQALNPSNGQSIDPEQKIRLLESSGIMPKEDAQAAYKELGEIQGVEAQRKNFINSFRDIHSQFGNGLLSPKDRASAKKAFIGMLQKATEGRYNNDAAIQLGESIFPDQYTSDETAEKMFSRGNAIFDAEVAGKAPHLRAYKISTPVYTNFAKNEVAPQRKK